MSPENPERSAVLHDAAAGALGEVWRDDWGRLLSLLVRRFRRLDLAEEALAEAFARAAERWPGDGVPSNPAGWLVATARRVALDRIKHEGVVARKLPLLAVDAESSGPDDESQLGDIARL